MNMFNPDNTCRTIRLPVVLEDGRLSPSEGQVLPMLKKKVHAELVLRLSDLLDEKERLAFLGEQRTLFLPKGTRLWARVKDDSVPQDLSKHRASKRFYTGGSELGVPFDLAEDLFLRIRPGKSSVFADCTCRIPSLNFTAGSVNEAYTRISTAFEPSRRSHTGNVFTCVFYEGKVALNPLDELRSAVESSSPQPPL